MSIKIKIGTHVINFPTSGTDANWAEAVTDFAQYTAEQLNGTTSPYDVVAQVTSVPESGNTQLYANFDHTSVRAFTFIYSIARTSSASSSNIVETGTLIGTYGTSGWILQDEYNGNKKSDGTPYHLFYMSGDTVYITTYPLDSGTYASGSITYSAKILPITV